MKFFDLKQMQIPPADQAINSMKYIATINVIYGLSDQCELCNIKLLATMHLNIIFTVSYRSLKRQLGL